MGLGGACTGRQVSVSVCGWVWLYECGSVSVGCVWVCGVSVLWTWRVWLCFCWVCRSCQPWALLQVVCMSLQHQHPQLSSLGLFGLSREAAWPCGRRWSLWWTACHMPQLDQGSSRGAPLLTVQVPPMPSFILAPCPASSPQLQDNAPAFSHSSAHISISHSLQNHSHHHRNLLWCVLSA